MKKILLFVLVLSAFFSDTKAANGDTTWVQAHSGVWLDWYGDFDSTVTFPDASLSYRRVYMYFTLGKYVCPGNPQYCSDWDYTVQTHIMTPAGDTFELGRFITPYARSTRMPSAWKGLYVFDVTDFYPILKNNATVRVHYSGYSGGFTADVKFAFIEGTPPRNVLGIQNVWNGSFRYGHGPVAINDALSDVSLVAPVNTVSAESRFTITGHGGDGQNCAEFCPNNYTLYLNNNQLVQQNFWKSDCGFNQLYPQNGTWVYNRAGWCPGELITPYVQPLSGVSGGMNYTLKATFPPYASSGGGSLASYIIEHNVFSYGAFNKSLDVSVEDILRPTSNEAYFRMNPSLAGPKIRVRNDGGSVITSLKIEYGVEGKPASQYNWTGSISSLAEQEIDLPELWDLRIATGTNNGFYVKVLEVNGQADEDVSNNELHTLFDAAPVWNVHLRISMTTNGSVANGFSETSWVIYDNNDNVVAQRINNAPGTTYNDTLELGPATYRLEVTDAGCDGVNWWAYQFYQPNPGVGNVFVRNMASLIPLPLKGYYGGDFGCGFTQYFRTEWPAGVQDVSTTAGMEVFPNPAKETVSVQLSGLPVFEGTIEMVDVTGRIVLSQQSTGAVQELNVAHLTNGVYSVVYRHKDGKTHRRLMIAK